MTHHNLNPDETLIAYRTVQAASELLETIMLRQTAKEWAKSLCKPHKRSEKSVTGTSVLYNVVDGVQKLPARRHNIRRKLPESLSKVHRSDLSEILRQFVNMGLLRNITEPIPLPRGRPSGLGFEDTDRGGMRSFYEKSVSLADAERALKKLEVRRSINNALIESGILPKFLKFRNLILYHLERMDEVIFSRQMEPFPFVKEKIREKPKVNEFFLNKIRSMGETDLEKEAEEVAQITLRKNKDNVNLFINILAAALSMAKEF